MLRVLEMERTKKIKTDGRHLSWIFCATVQSLSCPSPMSTWLHQSDTRWTCCCLCKFGPLWYILKYDFHLSKQIPSLIHLIWCNRGTNPNQPRILFLIWKTFRYFNWTQAKQPVNKWPQKLKVFLPSSAPGAVSWGGSSWRWRGRCIQLDRRRQPHGWPPDREVSTYQHCHCQHAEAAAWCQHCSRWLTLQLAL